MQYFISELIILINKHVNALFISCSIHHFGLAFNVGGLVDVRQTETDGEIEPWIRARSN